MPHDTAAYLLLLYLKIEKLTDPKKLCFVFDRCKARAGGDKIATNTQKNTITSFMCFNV